MVDTFIIAQIEQEETIEQPVLELPLYDMDYEEEREVKEEAIEERGVFTIDLL